MGAAGVGKGRELLVFFLSKEGHFDNIHCQQQTCPYSKLQSAVCDTNECNYYTFKVVPKLN